MKNYLSKRPWILLCALLGLLVAASVAMVVISLAHPPVSVLHEQPAPYERP